LFKSEWEEFIYEQANVWNLFTDFWLNSEIPVHIVRYEDLLQ